MVTFPSDLSDEPLTVVVSEKVAAAENVLSLKLRSTTGGPLPVWSPGAHVDLILPDTATRQYSLCGDPLERDTYRLGVLRDPQGRGSSMYVHDRLGVGDVVALGGPRNHFSLVTADRYVFIAGGIGITPILPMLLEAERAGADWNLVYGGRTRASMAFLEELAVFGDRVAVWPQDELGLLDLEGLLSTPTEGKLVYCCGPEPLLRAVEQRCEQGWPSGSVHVERFSPKAAQTDGTNDGQFEVFLSRSGIALNVSGDQTVLEALRQVGISVPSSCAEGLCGTCETAVLEGRPDHRDSVLSSEEQEANDCMMLCVSRALSPRLVLDI